MVNGFKPVSAVLIAAALVAPSSAYADLLPERTEITRSQQDGVVTGTVVDELGPVIGATVVVKGTTNGAITDLDGKFTLNGVKNGDVIEISYIGYTTQSVTYTGQKSLSITLAEDTQQLQEVVVTALGMKRATKALGYAMTEMKGEELSASVINPVSALQGKVAGVEIAQSDGGMFGSNKILIRGASTLGKNNQPIYVVDGVILDNSINDATADWDSNSNDWGNELKNLNPDDFETVSVLKGAAATALYGSRGLNGAVVITTKSGKGAKGLGINFSQTFGFDVVTGQPDFQNTYMDGPLAGYAGQIGAPNINDNYKAYVFDDAGNPSLLRLNRDFGWTGMAYGAKFSDWDKIEWYDGSIIDSKPYKNNFKDAYETGFSSNTNVAITGGNETTNFYTSLSYRHATGVTPNNSFDRLSLLTKASHKISKDVTLEASLSFANSTPRNAEINIGERFIDGTWDRTYDAAYFRDKYKGEHGGLASNQYGDKYGSIPGRNIWWNIWENDRRQKETVVRPSLKLTAELTPWLKWITEGNYNYYYTRYTSEAPGAGYANEGGSFQLSQSVKEQTNLNTNFMFNHTFGDWTVNGFLRGEYYNNYVQSMNAWTNGGLIIPNKFFLENGKNGWASSGSIGGEKRMFSVAFQAGFSWKDQVYVDVTGRNDWSSSLVYANETGNYSYFYPSVNASWLIHETFRGKLPEWISFAKIRGSWAQVGNDTAPYTINSAYSLFTTNSNGKYVYGLNMPSTIYSSDLKPERKTSWEIGLDWRFFNNRIGIDATYYKENTKDQIMSVSVPWVSGVGSQLINAGNIQNSGVEIALNTTPIENKDWTWDLNFTYTKNTSKIVELSDLVADYIALEGSVSYGNYRAGSVAKVGGEYGVIMSDAAPKRDEATGLPVLGYRAGDRNAYELRSGKAEEIGKIQPDFLGSVGTSLRYKNWSLRASFDMRFGGHIASYGSRYGTCYGYTAASLENSDPDHGGLTWKSAWDGITYNDGVIPEGILQKGTVLAQPNGSEYTVGSTATSPNGETYADLVAKGVLEPTHASAWTYRQNSWGGGVVNDNWFKELNYIAFRELSLSYSCPSNWAKKIGAKGLNFTASARNLGYLLNTMPNGENPEAVRGTSAAEFRVRSFNGLTTNFTFTINAKF